MRRDMTQVVRGSEGHDFAPGADVRKNLKFMSFLKKGKDKVINCLDIG